MSFSNSLHANASPHHFERIAKNLLTKRTSGDTSTCDVKIKLKHGAYDMVHSVVVCAHSLALSAAFENQRPPYRAVDLTEFDPKSVSRVVDWMYSGEIIVPESELALLLAVASYLRVNLLQMQIEQVIRNLRGDPIKAINIASERSFSVRPETAFRPYLTVFHVMDETMNRLVLELLNALPSTRADQVAELTLNSVIATMAAVIPLDLKVPLINMAIQWILLKKPSREIVHSILQSIVISDVTMDTLYSLRYTLKQYLSDPQVAGKSELAITPSGAIGLRIDPRKGKDQSNRSIRTVASYTRLDDDHQKPLHTFKPQYRLSRTRSEISAIENLPDPFVKSLATPDALSSPLRRETTDGFPKFFTKSEVENLQAMSDPFQKSEREETLPKPVNVQVSGFSHVPCTAKFGGWSDDIIEKNKAAARQRCARSAKYTASDIALNRQLPDPFLPSARSPAATYQHQYVPDRQQHQFSQHRSQPRQKANQQPPQQQQKSPSAQQSQQGPVILKPFTGFGFGQPNPFGFNQPVFKDTSAAAAPSKSNQSFSGRSSASSNSKKGSWKARKAHANRSFTGGMNTNSKNSYRPADFIVTGTSSTSTTSSVRASSPRNPPMHGIRKTASEIAEINALPSLHSSASNSSFGNGNNSSKKQKKIQRSQYLYPN